MHRSGINLKNRGGRRQPFFRQQQREAQDAYNMLETGESYVPWNSELPVGASSMSRSPLLRLLPRRDEDRLFRLLFFFFFLFRSAFLTARASCAADLAARLFLANLLR